MEIFQKVSVIAAVIAAILTRKADLYHQGSSMGETGKELVLYMDGEIIYPLSTEMIDEKKVGDWVYFRYVLEEPYHDDTISWPILCRYQKNGHVVERVTEGSCYSYEVLDGHVYYMDSATTYQDHGTLYVSEPDGRHKRILEEELYDFQIVDEKYIYYVYRHDTLGVGLDGHALHRMNLDGSDIMIAAYEVSGTDESGTDAMRVGHFQYELMDGWVDYGAFKMELGEPADGYEKIVFKDIGDNDWIYYVTNRLMKARKDGSEQTELDGAYDYYYEVEKVEDGWIYYIKGGVKYRIRTDGTGREMRE